MLIEAKPCVFKISKGDLNQTGLSLYYHKTTFMKLLTLTIALLMMTNISAQTNVISNKSHAGDLALLDQEPDDFGERYIPPNTDSVILINPTCIIEVKQTWNGQNKYHDTIRNHFYLPINQIELESFKKQYPSTTKFVGFDKAQDSIQPRPKSHHFQQNGVPLFFGVVILLIALYSFLPLFRVKSND